VPLPTYAFERQRYWYAETAEAESQQVESLDSGITTETASALGAHALRLPSMPASGIQECPTKTSADDMTQQVVQQQLHVMKQQLEAWQN
jgi:hypothetical protein